MQVTNLLYGMRRAVHLRRDALLFWAGLGFAAELAARLIQHQFVEPNMSANPGAADFWTYVLV